MANTIDNAYGAREEKFAQFSADYDRMDEQQWTRSIERFDDANIRQAWSYGKVLFGQGNCSTAVIRRAGEVVALAQVKISKLPVSSIGIATLNWGPLWRVKEREPDLLNFEYMVHALKAEYAVKRSLQLRIYPNLYESDPYAAQINDILVANGFSCSQSRYRTIVMDLTPSLAELKKGLVPRWRTDLNKSEKNGLQIDDGTEELRYDEFMSIYEEMHDRKGFKTFVNPEQYRDVQRELPDNLKMKILICRHEGEIAAAAITSVLGDTGVAILWATNPLGRETKAAYFLQWKTIEYLKSCGCLRYDIGGINPDENPGSYRFKSGLCGKYGMDVQTIGRYDLCESFLSKALVNVLSGLKEIALNLRAGKRLKSRDAATV